MSARRSRRTEPGLVSMPPVLPHESPASWLSRAALSQGIRVEALLQYLGIDKHADVDLVFLSGRLPALANRCGIRPEDFAVARGIIKALHSVDRGGLRFLLRGERGRPRYRACPKCFATHRTAYFGIHERFAVWRYCPLHDCLLIDACANCRSNIELPRDLWSVKDREGAYIDLGRCRICGAQFRKIETVDITTLGESISSMDRLLMANGRAVLAALWKGHVIFHADGPREPLSRLRQLERSGLLPSGRVKLFSGV